MDHTIEELEQIARDAQQPVEQREEALEELARRATEQQASTEQAELALQENLTLRLTALLSEMFNRPAAETAEEETVTSSVIEAALEIGAVELLPEIERAYAEDRVDLQIVGLDMVYDEFDLPRPPAPARRQDGLYLLIKCNACRRVREDFTRFVLVDEPSLDEKSDSRHSAFIIDHEYTCPKCGAVEQYTLSPLEWIRLMQMDEYQILAMLENRPPDTPLRPHPRVFYMRSQAFGREMHPFDILSEYRGRIALNPQNADLHSGLANSLRYLGRYEQALASYRRAVELAPLNATYLYEAASAEHDFGDLQAAHELYERCVATGRIQGSGELEEAVRASLQGLKALARGERSPWDYKLINASGARLLPPARTGTAGAGAKKDKRRKRH